LADIDIPDMNGFQLCEKILAININVKICFMSLGEVKPGITKGNIYPIRQEGKVYQDTDQCRLFVRTNSV
jgi:CheY-like chemotaxis protein